MITELGIIAGDIWHYLDENKEATLSTLEENLDKHRDLLLMSLGWLAREGHIILEQYGNDYKIVLRTEK